MQSGYQRALHLQLRRKLDSAALCWATLYDGSTPFSYNLGSGQQQNAVFATSDAQWLTIWFKNSNVFRSAQCWMVISGNSFDASIAGGYVLAQQLKV